MQKLNDGSGEKFCFKFDAFEIEKKKNKLHFSFKIFLIELFICFVLICSVEYRHCNCSIDH